MRLSEQLMNKIGYTCQKIPKLEWSGIVFFNESGSLSDPDSFILTIEEMFPMSKDDSASTGFEYGGDVTAFMASKPTLLQASHGMIHSHHTMPAFFSPTDMEELADNCKSYNYYLSIVVNNAMDIKARISVYVEEEQHIDSKKKYRNERGEVVIVPYRHTQDDCYMEYYDCIVETPDVAVEQWFEARVNYIIAEAEKKTREKAERDVAARGRNLLIPFKAEEKKAVADFIPKFIVQDLEYHSMAYNALEQLEKKLDGLSLKKLEKLYNQYTNSFDTMCDNWFEVAVDEIEIFNSLNRILEIYGEIFPTAVGFMKEVATELSFGIEDEPDQFDLFNPNNTEFYGK